MSSQAIFTRMEEIVAYELGWDRTSNNWSTDQDNLFETIKKEGLSLFENPPVLPGERTTHQWTFLYPFASLQLSPSYSTGTITVDTGSVDLTGGTFPTWAAQGDLWFTDDDDVQQRVPVASRTDADTLAIDDPEILATVVTYSLKRHSYDLPTNFGGLYGSGFTFRRDSTYAGQEIREVGPHELRLYDSSTLDGVPCMYCLEPIAITATASTLWKVSFAPLPNATMHLEYQYRVLPADVDSTNDYPYGGPAHSETILAAIKHAARMRVHRDESGYGDFMRKLETSVRFDRQNKPTDLGRGRNRELQNRLHHYNASIDDATFSWA